MSQPTPGSNWGPPTGGPASPSIFAQRVRDSLDALNSEHKGATAPSYRVSGTTWLDDSTAPWVRKYWDGSQWLVIGTVNPTTHLFKADVTTLPLLGAVSQAGGTPTGAMIERGSNANGEYVRYADGTQICWTKSTSSIAVNSASGQIFIGTFSALTFPAAFATIPVVNYMPQSTASNVLWIASIISSSHTTTQAAGGYVCSNAARVAGSITIDVVAVGRWF